MKCHYEVLGVETCADAAHIKSAYRRQALRWHPDKNVENPEHAAEQFKMVQAAYEVLSDPQDKAWYDRHRDEILHKEEFANFKDDTTDILEFFTSSCYRGFGSGSRSFYSVYSDVFNRIVQVDKKFCDESDDEMPQFGTADSDYDNVVHPFYVAWQSYCTKLSYVWVEKYDIDDAPDRRISRLIEKENKKERDKMKKKRTDIVRDLVGFIRKRDPRVQKNNEKLRQLAEEQRIKNEQKRLESLRKRIEVTALYEEQNQEQIREDCERMSLLENQLKDEFGFSSSEDDVSDASEDDDADDKLFCAACNKQFKTKMALKNHNKSKKHREKMTLLRVEMIEEKLAEDNDLKPEHCDVTSNHDDDSIGVRPTKKQKKKKQMKQNTVISIGDNNVADDVYEDSSHDHDNSELAEENDLKQKHCDVASNHDNDGICIRKTKKQKKKKENTVISIGDNNVADDAAEYTSHHDNSDGNAQGQSSVPTMHKEIINIEHENVISSASAANSEEAESKDTTGGKKGKGRRQRNSSKAKVQALTCATCQTSFATRNKLFQHLKQTKHAAPVTCPLR